MDMNIYANEFAYDGLSTDHAPFIVAEGDLQNRHFIVADQRGYPCVFIECPDQPATRLERVGLSGHGGLVWQGGLPKWIQKLRPDDKRIYISWNYCADGDYVAMRIVANGDYTLRCGPSSKKWAVSEVLEEVRIYILKLNAHALF